MRRAWGVLTAVAALLLVAAACAPSAVTSASTPPPAAKAASESPSGWLYSDPSGVLFLQWTEANNALQGSAQYWQPPNAKTFAFTGNSGLTVNGVRNGDAVSLTVNVGLGTSTTWNGTLAGGVLTLQVPQSDGKLQPLVFHPGSVADYNAAVNDRQQLAADQNRQAQQKAADQADAKSKADAAAKTVAAATNTNTTMVNDLAEIKRLTKETNATSVAADLKRFETDWATAQKDFAKISTLTDCGDRMSQAGTVSSDGGTIQSDAGSVASTIAGNKMTRDELTQALDKAGRDYTAMTNAIAAAGKSAPAPAVTHTQLDQATGDARQAITASVARDDAAKATSADYQAKADALTVQARATAGSC